MRWAVRHNLIRGPGRNRTHGDTLTCASVTPASVFSALARSVMSVWTSMMACLQQLWKHMKQVGNTGSWACSFTHSITPPPGLGVDVLLQHDSYRTSTPSSKPTSRSRGRCTALRSLHATGIRTRPRHHDVGSVVSAGPGGSLAAGTLGVGRCWAPTPYRRTQRSRWRKPQ